MPRLVAVWHRKQYGIDGSPDDIVVTTLGSSAAMLLVFAALADPGPQVLLIDLHYACCPSWNAAKGLKRPRRR